MKKSVPAIFFVLSAFCMSAHADQIILHTVSWHSMKKYIDRDKFVPVLEQTEVNGRKEYIYNYYNESRRYNNINPGIGYLWRDQWNVGIYKNSYSMTTVYAGRTWQWSTPVSLGDRPINTGFTLMAVSGYTLNGGDDIRPAATLNLHLPVSSKITANIHYIPSVRSDMSHALHLSIGYRVK